MSLDRLYRETIDYLFGLQKHGIKLALSNSFRLMELMGGPQEKFRSVHVAGTNGKGSTAVFIAASWWPALCSARGGCSTWCSAIFP